MSDCINKKNEGNGNGNGNGNSNSNGNGNGNCNGNGDVNANANNGNGSKKNASRKRGRRQNDDAETSAYDRAYENVTYRPIPSTGRPGTPHRFFEESYEVHFRRGATSNGGGDNGAGSTDVDGQNHQQRGNERGGGDGGIDGKEAVQIVHRHVNGLVVVTAGRTVDRSFGSHGGTGSSIPEGKETTITTTETNVSDGDIADEDATEEKGDGKQQRGGFEKLEWLVDISPAASESAEQKRKQQSKMLRGKQVEGTVRPTTVVARITTTTDVMIPLRACVWGTVLEINRDVNSELLRRDPLLDGYLAVVLPSGTFPPKSNDTAPSSATTEQQQQRTSEENTIETPQQGGGEQNKTSQGQ